MRKYNKRICFSITKYNPKYRDRIGNYKKDEWISVSDIGAIYDKKLFTYEEYLKVETQYIRAVFLCMDFFESKSVKINHIFKLDSIVNKNSTKYDSIKEQMSFFHLNDRIKDKYLIETLLKLRLREYIVELELIIDSKSNTEILFGFDYYMYLKTNKDVSELKTIIEKIGLYFL